MATKNKLTALLFDNLTGVEIFGMIMLGQVGIWLARGKPVPVNLALANCIFGALLSVSIVNYAAYRGWDDNLTIAVGAVTAVIGLNLIISLIRNYVAARYVK